MEHIIPRTASLFPLAAVITMMIAGTILLTAGNIAAATGASHFFSFLGRPCTNVSVGTTVHLTAIAANHTPPNARVKWLVSRVNVLTSTIPLILVVTICTLAVLLYLAYRRWYRKLTSPQPAPLAQQPSPAPAPSRRQHIRRLPGLPVYNSQVTLPRYSPPPPSYRERLPEHVEHVEHVELVEISHGRSPENRAEEHESSPAASPAPSD